MIHPEMANVSKAQIKAKLATMFKSKDEAISVFGLKTKFGGGRSTGFALVYDNVDIRKKYDHKKQLKRVCFFFPYFDLLININQDGFIPKPKRTRKQKKEIKGRVKKVRGIAKEKAAQAGGKKK